jgi:AcrR family transcriptional regulator
MARLRSPEKRVAILEAATAEIAEGGLGVATAKIARRAGIAEGTLFTYFASKDELLNAVYMELKTEAYARIHHGFPIHSSLEQRARHIWFRYISWVADAPAKRKAVAQLSVSEVVTSATRAKAAKGWDGVERMLSELGEQGPLRALPTGYVSALMLAMLEATMEYAARKPRQKDQIVEGGFAAFWRACGGQAAGGGIHPRNK